MITLNVYLTPKAGQTKKLKTAIRDNGINPMSKQLGFPKSVTLNPFDHNLLLKLRAPLPRHTHEIVSYWESEEERLAWVNKDIHKKVWQQIVDFTENITYTPHSASQH